MLSAKKLGQSLNRNWALFITPFEYRTKIREVIAKRRNKFSEIKMIHQATANRWSLSSHMVSVVVRILFSGHQHLHVFVTYGHHV